MDGPAYVLCTMFVMFGIIALFAMYTAHRQTMTFIKNGYIQKIDKDSSEQIWIKEEKIPQLKSEDK